MIAAAHRAVDDRDGAQVKLILNPVAWDVEQPTHLLPSRSVPWRAYRALLRGRKDDSSGGANGAGMDYRALVGRAISCFNAGDLDG